MSAASEPIGRRDVIDRAWARSMMCGLNPGSPLDLPFAPPFDSDSTFTRAARPVMDYLGGLLVCKEAGAVIVDAEDRDLVVLEHADRRTPVAAATPELLVQLVDARRSIKRP